MVRSRAESRASVPSLLFESAMGPICPHFPSSNQALEQLVLRLRGLFLADLTGLARRFDLHELRADHVLVVELRLGLLLDALGEPDGAAHRRERKRQKAGDQAHVPTASCSSVKLYGGSGPMYRTRMRPSTSSASRATASLNSSTRERSTRKAALTAASGVPGGSRRAATASGSSLPITMAVSPSRHRSTSPATRSPSSIRPS